MTVALSVTGIGFWTPTYPSWAAWSGQTPDARCAEPPCARIPRALLRGTSVVTRAALEAAEQAALAGGADLATVPTVFASDLGEIQTAVALIDLVATTGAGSPLRFKSSVHNTAGGILGIAHGNRSFSTAMSAGEGLVAMALIEAWAYLTDNGGDVLVVFAMEPTPPALAPSAHSVALGVVPLGIALSLRARGDSVDRTRARIERVGVPTDAPPQEVPSRILALGADPVVAAVSLAEAICAGGATTVSLGGGWCAVLLGGSDPRP